MEAVKLENAEQFREAIGVLAKGHTELEAVVRAQAEVLNAQDLQIRTLTALVDNMHGVLVAAGLATPRPAGDPIVH